ncbi:16092_t:CDS:2, partial [Racocetra fulgida]
MDNFPNIGASGEDVDNFVDSFEDFTEGTTENNPDLDGSNDEFAEFEDATFEPATDLPEQSSGSTLVVTLPSKPINPIPTSNKAVTLSAPVSRSSTPDSTHNNLSSSSHGNLPKQKISQTQIDEPKQLDI